jgi:CRISPR/Cas system-associated exonuclease Cas4 (RecB family)
MYLEKAFCEFVKPKQVNYVLDEVSDKKTLFEADEITKRLHNSYLRSEIDKSTWTKKSISAYDLTGCIKKLYFRLRGISPSDTPNYPYSNIIFGIGNSVHQALVDAIQPEEVEVSFKSYIIGFELNMRCDAICYGKILHEYKTVEKIDDDTELKPEHLQQAVIYAYLLNKIHHRNIQYIQIIYVSRGKVSVKVFNVEVNEDIMNKVGNRLNKQLRELKDCLDQYRVPSFDSEYCSKDCKFCEYATFCRCLSS